MREARGPERPEEQAERKAWGGQGRWGSRERLGGKGGQELSGEAGAEEGGGSTWMSLVGKSAQEETAVDPPCIPQR